MARRPARIYQEADHLILETPYIPALVEGIKAIPGRRWDGERKLWRVPVAASATVAALAKEYQLPFESAETAPELAQKFSDVASIDTWRSELEMEQAMMRLEVDLPDPIPGLQGQLLPWQQDAVRFAVRHRRALIADDMGVGKTLEALAALAVLGSTRPVIVAPATAKLTWAYEISRFFPAWGITVLSGTQKHPSRLRLGSPSATTLATIINYDILADWLEQLQSHDALIFDESHKLKSRTTVRTKAALQLLKQNRPGIVLMLSGTPIVNCPFELISQIDILGQLPKFGGAQNFLWRYCAPYRDRFGFHTDGAAHLDELNYRLRAQCMIRRLKSEVMSARQEPQLEMVPVALTPTELASYRKSEALLLKLIAEQEGLDLPEPLPLAQGQLDEETESTIDGNDWRGAFSRLRRRLGTVKSRAIIDWIKEFLEDTDTQAMARLDGTPEPPRKLVVYAEHHDLVDVLSAALPNSLRITGREPLPQRQRATELFQSDPRRRVMIISTAGNENITLTAASDILIAELPWTPKDLTQAIARIDRQGQTRRVAVYEMIAEDTIENDVLNLLTRKLQVITQGTDGVAPKSLSKSLTSEMLEKFRRQLRVKPKSKSIASSAA